MTGIVDKYTQLKRTKWTRLLTVIVVCSCGLTLGLPCTTQVLLPLYMSTVWEGGQRLPGGCVCLDTGIHSQNGYYLRSTTRQRGSVQNPCSTLIYPCHSWPFLGKWLARSPLCLYIFIEICILRKKRGKKDKRSLDRTLNAMSNCSEPMLLRLFGVWTQGQLLDFDTK